MVWFCCKYLVKGVCSAALTVVFTVVDDSWFLLCRSRIVAEGC